MWNDPYMLYVMWTKQKPNIWPFKTYNVFIKNIIIYIYDNFFRIFISAGEKNILWLQH